MRSNEALVGNLRRRGSQVNPFLRAPQTPVPVLYEFIRNVAIDNLGIHGNFASTDVHFGYDALNRMTNMVDAAGTTVFSYTAGNQLLTEDGPFSSDTVTNTYVNRLRKGLALQQPTSFWTNGFIYDPARRLGTIRRKLG